VLLVVWERVAVMMILMMMLQLLAVEPILLLR